MENGYTIQIGAGFILTFLVTYGTLASAVGVLLYRVGVLTKIVFNDHGELNFKTVKEMEKVEMAISETKELCDGIQNLAGKVDRLNEKLNGKGDDTIITLGKHRDVCAREHAEYEITLLKMFKSFEGGLLMKMDDRDDKFLQAINSRDDRMMELMKKRA